MASGPALERMHQHEGAFVTASATIYHVTFVYILVDLKFFLTGSIILGPQVLKGYELEPRAVPLNICELSVYLRHPCPSVPTRTLDIRVRKSDAFEPCI